MRRLPLRSPPRVRGKAKNRCRSCPLTRITPACAGKRRSYIRTTALLRDHPRVCGEKFWALVRAVMALGSPPRMRGKDVYTVLKINPSGITPAYAGKRQSWTSATWLQRDHPRVCGEKFPTSSLWQTVPGSPPRVRGKVISSLQCDFLSGITPAYAGKRPSAGRLSG